jgi:hypothetical protein
MHVGRVDPLSGNKPLSLRLTYSKEQHEVFTRSPLLPKPSASNVNLSFQYLCASIGRGTKCSMASSFSNQMNPDRASDPTLRSPLLFALLPDVAGLLSV